jgi:hypothetical protein
MILGLSFAHHPCCLNTVYRIANEKRFSQELFTYNDLRSKFGFTLILPRYKANKKHLSQELLTYHDLRPKFCTSPMLPQYMMTEKHLNQELLNCHYLWPKFRSPLINTALIIQYIAQCYGSRPFWSVPDPGLNK